MVFKGLCVSDIYLDYFGKAWPCMILAANSWFLWMPQFSWCRFRTLGVYIIYNIYMYISQIQNRWFSMFLLGFDWLPKTIWGWSYFQKFSFGIISLYTISISQAFHITCKFHWDTNSNSTNDSLQAGWTPQAIHLLSSIENTVLIHTGPILTRLGGNNDTSPVSP